MQAGFDYATAVRQGARLRVATKFVQTAREHFAAKGVHVDLIKLYGSMELAPLVGLSDVIVDLVSTGGTLKANLDYFQSQPLFLAYAMSRLAEHGITWVSPLCNLADRALLERQLLAAWGPLLDLAERVLAPMKRISNSSSDAASMPTLSNPMSATARCMLVISPPPTDL